MKKRFLLPCAATLAALTTITHASVLPGVPMQGGMVMPMVSYQEGTDSLSVMVPPDVPQLTPLLVSNPGDSFDPADPWFDSLDPSRQGASFSRRYGFVMASAYPVNRQIWIRRLSSSPELNAYRCANNSPKAWEPIFGTDGSPNARYWNGDMFHPAFTAPPGTNALTSAFELYLVDTASGLEVPNSATDPILFHFTNVHDGRPELTMDMRVVVAWPATTPTGWALESADRPDAIEWTPVTNSPVQIEVEPCVVLPAAEAQQFFRMRLIP